MVDFPEIIIFPVLNEVEGFSDLKEGLTFAEKQILTNLLMPCCWEFQSTAVSRRHSV
ncbi:MAG: hypothetical protein HYT36_02380 [Candidatus Staskawiczbacteria bacterium]|nr:hypothetical protein [Candidatus Staskawiczbacteria bacterium]